MENTPHHLIINTALGVKSYNSGEEMALWKYIFFDNHSQCSSALTEVLSGAAGTHCSRDSWNLGAWGVYMKKDIVLHAGETRMVQPSGELH